jgi:hypothetical protein
MAKSSCQAILTTWRCYSTSACFWQCFSTSSSSSPRCSASSSRHRFAGISSLCCSAAAAAALAPAPAFAVSGGLHPPGVASAPPATFSGPRTRVAAVCGGGRLLQCLCVSRKVSGIARQTAAGTAYQKHAPSLHFGKPLHFTQTPHSARMLTTGWSQSMFSCSEWDTVGETAKA